MKPKLTISKLKKAAKEFCETESNHKNKDLFGVTDGKAVGTYIEHKFQAYNLLVFVYQKTDDNKNKEAILDFVSCSFLEKERTADYTTTFRIREMIKDGANKEDIVAYLNDKNIPADELTLNSIAERILQDTPKQGYLTISNALQWRLQYGRVVKLTKTISGISKLIDKVAE